jgi:hypothetical protein
VGIHHSIYVKQIGYEHVDWSNLAYNTIPRPDLMDKKINIWLAKEAKHFWPAGYSSASQGGVCEVG